MELAVFSPMAMSGIGQKIHQFNMHGDGRMSEENNIEATINAATGLLKEVPIYQDSLQPAAKELGVALLTVAKTVNVALAPVSALIWGYDQIKEFAATRLAQKLKDVPEEKIVTPDATVAGPALEALKYTGHKEDLAEMYASLLATAMNADTRDSAHPSFVEIIKQLSPDEAKLIAYVKKHSAVQPMISVRSTIGKNAAGYYALMYYTHAVGHASCEQPGRQASYWVNLQRLGLLELREDYILSPKNDGIDRYDEILQDEYVRSLEQKIVEDGKFVDIRKGSVMMTPFGLQFCDACISA